MTVSKRHFALVAVLIAGAASTALAQPAPGPFATPQATVADGKYVMKDGQSIYHNVCANCHMQDAKGTSPGAGAGVYPALAANPKLASVPYGAMVVIRGYKGMPSFGSMLDDGQVAEVLGYLRTHFGNGFPAPVTAESVKALR
jgi:mono/diheme cytochrome c family protein